MAKISSSLRIATPSGNSISATYSKEASATVDREFNVHPGDFQEILTIDTTGGLSTEPTGNSLADFKQLVAYNSGDGPIEIALKTALVDDADAVTHAELYAYPVFFIPAKGYLSIPSPRVVSTSGTATAPYALNYVNNTRATSQATLRLTQSTATYVSADGVVRKTNLSTTGVTNANGDLYVSGLHGKNNSDSDGGGDTGTYLATDGIIPGTVRVQFYTPAYQEFNLTGNGYQPQTSTSEPGLSASTAYAFKLNVDGGGATDLAFTTDGTDITWGSPTTGNGILKKIQDEIDAHELQADVSIVDGNLRFTSRSRNSTSSAIAITAPTSGTDFRDAGILANGQIATTAVRVSTQNDKNVMFDNGEGMLSRANGGSGWITYATPGSSTSAKCSLYITGAPANSSVKLSWLHGSVSGGNLSSATPTDNSAATNCLLSVYARALSFSGQYGLSGRKGKLRLVAVDNADYTSAQSIEAT